MALCSQALRREHPAIWALEPEQAGGGEVGRKGSEETWGARETETREGRRRDAGRQRSRWKRSGRDTELSRKGETETERRGHRGQDEAPGERRMGDRKTETRGTEL